MKRLDAEDLYLEEIRAARGQPVAEKVFAGIRLFTLACEFTKAGIRRQHPNADEARVLEILRERLELGRRLENRV